MKQVPQGITSGAKNVNWKECGTSAIALRIYAKAAF